jgi:hypothetical protein
MKRGASAAVREDYDARVMHDVPVQAPKDSDLDYGSIKRAEKSDSEYRRETGKDKRVAP